MSKLNLNVVNVKTWKRDIPLHILTSKECIAGNGKIPERSDTSEYIKYRFYYDSCNCTIFQEKVAK